MTNADVNKTLDQIQKVRAQNNMNWMAIMRLAFKHAPNASKQIMKKITKCDQRIIALTKELAE